MENMHDASHPAVIARLLHDHDLRPKKSAGQNFFCDAGLLDKMIRAAGVGQDESVLEIGPGLGALTQRLGLLAKRVVAVELDCDLLAPLAETVGELSNVEIVPADFLKLSDEDLLSHFEGAEVIRMVSNLPYCITTDAMQKLFMSKLPLASITALVQKEAAQRICAKPGEKQYGITAMMCAWYCDARILYDVPPECFFPRPGVTSAVIDIRFKAPRPQIACGDTFLWRVARGAIAMRRKTIINNLSSAGFAKDVALAALEQVGIEPSIRAEVLSIEKLAELALELHANM